jgi:uncharacterized protein
MTLAPGTPKLLAIGLAAGCFSGLLGVGGGTVMVPLLVLLLAFGERLATGTSLAVIVPVAIVGAGVQALYGNVDVADGVLVGLPAVGGVLVGTWLQQRWSQRAISLLFSGLLVVVAVQLVIDA